METPIVTHTSPEDIKYVYDPAEDSFLLLDAIEGDLDTLFAKNPAICLEIGSGSGVIITAVARTLPKAACFATDINPFACSLTTRTAANNKASVHMIHTDLVSGFLKNQVDVLIFNPPYVVTEDEEIHANDIPADNPFNPNITKSWAGGTDGRLVMDRVFDDFDNILSANGIAYILVIAENKPHEIITTMKGKGFNGSIIAERRIRGEHLFVLKFNRCS